MLRILILEDEAPARERLAVLLREVDPGCTFAGAVDSNAAATQWLARHAAPDLIFADIELGDGLSLELFRARPPSAPIVFTTAHDAYVLEAFATHGIAYLLKPVKPAELAAALKKYRELGRHFAGNVTSLLDALAVRAPAPNPTPPLAPPSPRQRILAQRGNAFQPVALADVAYFFSEHKLTFLVTRGGEKCLVNESLGALEAELAGGEFHRVNRNVLARASAVRSFAAVGKGRLAVELQPRPKDEILVSQENAAAFRAWLSR